jgi:homoserine/homoserine lactone efflux protein
MSFETWLLFVVTEGLLSLAPGPAVLFLLATALSKGVRHSIAANLAILSGNAIYFAISATGLGAIIMTSYDLFFAIKWIGAAYLVYLGVMTFMERGALTISAEHSAVAANPWRTYANGLVLQLSNPKTILFFTALLPQFIDPKAAASGAMSVPVQILILAITSAVLEFFILLGYALVADKARVYAGQPRFITWTNRACGSMLVAAGAMMAAIKKTA